jgi:hypothetical protein
MANTYRVLDEATVRNALNRLEGLCEVQNAKLDYLHAQLLGVQDAAAAAATEAMATRGTGKGKFLVDLKHMSPDKYAGLRCPTAFRTWSQDIKDLVARFSVELLQAMTATENQAERIPSNTIPSSVQDEDAQLRSALRAFTVGEPRAVINAAIDRGDSGLEIWRTLVTQYDPNNDTTRLDESTYILNPGRTKTMGEVQLLLTKWEDAMNHRSKMLGRAALDDDLKRSVLLKLLPATEEGELRHQRILFKTYEALRGRVIELISERTKGSAPMLHHIAEHEDEYEEDEEGEWIMRIEESGGRQHRVWTQSKGKGKGKWRGKGQDLKGKGYDAKGKAKGKGLECYRCGRTGHVRLDCYSRTHRNGGEPVELPKKGGLNTLEEESSETELHGIDICMLESAEPTRHSDWTTVTRKKALVSPFEKRQGPLPLLMVSPFGKPKYFLADPFSTATEEQPTTDATISADAISESAPRWLSAKVQSPSRWVGEWGGRPQYEDQAEWEPPVEVWETLPTEEEQTWWEGQLGDLHVEPAPGLAWYETPLEAEADQETVEDAEPYQSEIATSDVTALQRSLRTLAASAIEASVELLKVGRLTNAATTAKHSYYQARADSGRQAATCVEFQAAAGVVFQTEACFGSQATACVGIQTEACFGSSMTVCVGSQTDVYVGTQTTTCFGSQTHIGIDSQTIVCCGSEITGSDADAISSENFEVNDGSAWFQAMHPELELYAIDAMDVERNGWNRFDIVVDSGAAQSVADGNLWPNIARTESVGSRNGAVYLGPGKERIPNRGQKTMNVKTTGSNTVRKMTFQDAAIRKPLAAVSGITEKGNVVLFDKRGSFIAPEDAPEVKTIRELIRQVKNRIELEEKNGIYIMPIWVQNSEAAEVFSRPGH